MKTYKKQYVINDRLYIVTNMNKIPPQPTKSKLKQQIHQPNDLVKQYPPPPALQGIVNILTSFSVISMDSLVGFADRICDEVLNLNCNTVVIANLGKDEEIDYVINKFLSHDHHLDLQITVENEIPLRNYFHQIIHQLTSKSLAKLSVLFYKLLCLKMLDTEVVNYFFLILILSHENITSNRDLKIIKACLRNLYQKQVIYIGVRTKDNPNKRKKGVKQIPINCHLYEIEDEYNNCFGLLAYIIYFGNMSHKLNDDLMKFDKQMLQKILAFPMQISSLILAFRNQFPNSLILQCDRNLHTLSECIIDNTLLKSLFRIYLDFKLDAQPRNNLYAVIQNLVRFCLTVQTVKNMIKVLEIGDMDNLEEKWKKMFSILKTTLPFQSHQIVTKQQIQSEVRLDSPNKLHEQLSWQAIEKSSSSPKNSNKPIKETDTLILTKQSFLSFNFEYEFNGFELTFASYNTFGEFILTKLKNQQQEIWLIIRHIDSTQFQIEAMTMSQNNVSINKLQLTWNPFEKHVLMCTVKGDKICFEFSETELNQFQESPELISSFTVNAGNIKPKQIQIGTPDKSIPCYFSQIYSFNISYYQKSTFSYIKYIKGKTNENSNKKITCMKKASLIQILKKLGDLDLFCLLVSHLIKKVDDESSLKVMLKEVVDFLQLLVVAKGVQGVKLTDQMKQHRFYNVRCLVWLASKYKRDSDSILEIFRVLEIRGIKRSLESLEILSNIGLWKQIHQKYHVKILQKIRQTCLQINPDSTPQMLQMVKRIILDYMIFYRNNQLLNENLQNQYLVKHSQILKLVFDIVVVQNVTNIVQFISFLLQILYILLDRTKNSDFIDTSIGFQIALLAYRILMVVRQFQFQSQRDKRKVPVKKSMKLTKTGLVSLKSMNNPNLHYNKDENLILQIEETLKWANQIIYCLKNQILHAEQKIKYYDWDWGEKQASHSSVFSHNKKFKVVEETQILKICEQISMGLCSYDRNTFAVFNSLEHSSPNFQLFWDMNLFDENVSSERFVDTIRFGNYSTIVWTDQKIISVLERSFDLTESNAPINLPQKFLESMKANDINLIHNAILGVFYDKCQQNNPLQKQKCFEKIIYIISILPDSLYSNTHLLRQELRKDKRNFRIIELIQKHLIIKELAKEGFKLIKQIKLPETQELTSTLVAFDNTSQKADSEQKLNATLSEETEEVSSKTSKPRKGSQDLAVFSQLQNVDYQESFWEVPNCHFQTISNDKIRQSLEHLRLLANPTQMQAFYKVSSIAQSKEEAREHIEGRIATFNLNIDSIIKIFQQNSQEKKADRLSQLQSFIFFIERHLYAFSKMIVSEFLFKDTKQIKVQEELIKSKRKKSFQTANNYKFKQTAEAMLEQFLRNRRKSVYKMENVWYNVEKNNKDFWEIFFKAEKKNQSVDLTCNSLKLRGLIKVDQQKRQIELPKNMTISNKFSISAESEKDDPHEQCFIFEDANLYQQQQGQESDKQQPSKQMMTLKQKVYNEQLSKKKLRKQNQFQVSYITTTAIYQGIIICQANTIRFIQNLVPSENFYDLICANENEQRTTFQIEKKRQKFEIALNERSTIIPKRYLYHDAAVQVFSQKRTYFFLFGKGSQREQFLKIHSHLRGTIQSQNQLIQAAQRQMERWVNGDISNYTYLMHLNDLSGRTFNDMSQYYIFPWVLTNYKSQKFNKKFLNNQKNYRDLSKPVGALNPKRFDELESRYKESRNYHETEGYLYGSFCSNPAIVCNYLVRLEPFSMHHFILQSRQFDLADRIFYSVANQFTCCYSNIGDYKQLIPEFYSCPQFLRNRNKYKFGQKQNKQVVNNVELPQWALYQFKGKKAKSVQEKSQSFLAEQQFIFRMRKCLESQYVTRNINYWIDLIFGLYNRKEKALQRNNLYISNIYKNELKKSGNKNKEMLLIFFKEFGQVPRDLFEREHKPYKNNRTYYKLGDSQSHLISQTQHKFVQMKRFYADSKFFISWNENMMNIVDIKNKTGLIERTENSITEIPLKSEDITQVRVITTETENEESKKLDLLIYLKSGKLIAREMSISTFRKKLEVKEEKQNFFFTTQFRLMEIYEEQKLMIFVCSNSIKIYQYSLIPNSIEKSGDSMFGSGRFQLFNNPSEQTIKILINKKLQLRLTMKFQFTQHRSRVEHICVCESYGLLISIDSNRKAYIMKIHSKQIEVTQYFRLKKLANCQNITQVQMHEMGYIIILTTLNVIHVYNLMGDYVAHFKGTMLREINSKMHKKVQSAFQVSKIQQESKPNTEPNQQIRKKSANEIKTDLIISCQFEQSDHQNSTIPSIMIAEEGTAQKKYHSTIPMPKQERQRKILRESPKMEQEEQRILSFKIWNQESSQLIIGTNFGCVYRFDLFMIEDFEKIDFSNSAIARKKEKPKQKSKLGQNIGKQQQNETTIDFISVNRIGRHSQCWVASSLGLFRIESEDYRNADKRNEQYRKKSVIE